MRATIPNLFKKNLTPTRINECERYFFYLQGNNVFQFYQQGKNSFHQIKAF